MLLLWKKKNKLSEAFDGGSFPKFKITQKQDINLYMPLFLYYKLVE
jgi:hypothetical protein